MHTVSKKYVHIFAAVFTVLAAITFLLCCCSAERQTACGITVDLIHREQNYTPQYKWYIGFGRTNGKFIPVSEDFSTICVSVDNTAVIEPFEDKDHLSFIHQTAKERYDGTSAVLASYCANYSEENFRSKTVHISGQTSERIPLPYSCLTLERAEYALFEERAVEPYRENTVPFHLLRLDRQTKEWDYLGRYDVDRNAVEAQNRDDPNGQALRIYGDYLCIFGTVWVDMKSNGVSAPPSEYVYEPFSAEKLISALNSIPALHSDPIDSVYVLDHRQIDGIDYTVFTASQSGDDDRSPVRYMIAESDKERVLRLLEICGLYDKENPFQLITPFELIPA